MVLALGMDSKKKRLKKHVFFSLDPKTFRFKESLTFKKRKIKDMLAPLGSGNVSVSVTQPWAVLASG